MTNKPEFMPDYVYTGIVESTPDQMPEVIYLKEHDDKNYAWSDNPTDGVKYTRTAPTPATGDMAAGWSCDENDFTQFIKWIERTRHIIPSDDSSEIVSWLYRMCGIFIKQKKTGVLTLSESALSTRSDDAQCSCGDSIPERDLKCINCQWVFANQSDDVRELNLDFKAIEIGIKNIQEKYIRDTWADLTCNDLLEIITKHTNMEQE